MFNWPLFLALTLACMPGAAIALPGTVKTIVQIAERQTSADANLPSTGVLVAISFVQTMLLFAVAAAVGTALAPLVGLHAPVFEALVSGEALWPALRTQLPASLSLGIGGAAVFLALYYWVFRPRLDETTVRAMETLRNRLGMWGRLFYGGIAEEVLTRWGLMTLLAWLGALIAGSPNAAVMWTAIVISGVLFGLGHAPSYLAAGCQRSPLFFVTMISLNLWASLLFGWLFWQYGLEAAMVGHMLFHLAWWPFDRRVYGRTVRVADA